MQRRDDCWTSDLAGWISRVTISGAMTRLAAAGCPVTANAIYHWIEGRHVPRPAVAAALERVSEGAITIADVYRHREQISSVAGDSSRAIRSR